MAIIKPLREFKIYPNSFTLIDEDNPRIKAQVLYKYMDLETALICLTHKSIRLVQPSEWVDKYERHFYNADYRKVTANLEDTPRLWASCFTTSRMSEASWNIYRYGKQGLGNRCVKFKISRSKFRQYLQKDKRIRTTFEGFMDYSVSDYDIQHLHLKSSPLYTSIFTKPFTLDKYLSLLLLKRAAFNYECEFRFMVTLENKKETIPQIFININWADVIKSVEVDKDMTDTEIDVLKLYLKQAGVRKEIIDSCSRVKLYDDPIDKVIIE